MVAFISDSERYQLAQAAGFHGNDALIATAISIAENPGGDPTAISPTNKNGTRDAGLWQINSDKWTRFGGLDAILSPITNARAAYTVFLEQGWNAWCTYWPTGCGGYNQDNVQVQRNWTAALARAQKVAQITVPPTDIGVPRDGGTPGTGAEPGTGTVPGNPIVTVPSTTSIQSGLTSALFPILGPLGAASEKLGFKPDLSGLILLLASIFAIIIGAIIWRGDDVKKTIAEAPQRVAEGAVAAVAA